MLTQVLAARDHLTLTQLLSPVVLGSEVIGHPEALVFELVVPVSRSLDDLQLKLVFCSSYVIENSFGSPPEQVEGASLIFVFHHLSPMRLFTIFGFLLLNLFGSERHWRVLAERAGLSHE